jgi:hypothetical protein
MVSLVVIVTIGILIVIATLVVVIRRRNMQYWLPSYFAATRSIERPNASEIMHVFLAICDHWEPFNNAATSSVAMEKVERWAKEYPRRYDAFRDSEGRPPQHTFFYPMEEYRPEHIDRIASLCRAGFGDVEVHLHHENDTAAALEDKLAGFSQTLFHRHGLLRRHPRTGEIAYGFIHGNWALCNSRPDGAWCGVDQELTSLIKTGCYADFTMPSAPSPTQTRMINSIYYAQDIPGRRKSHDFGIKAQVGRLAPADHLLMIQGPLTLDWQQRRFGFIPRIENGDVTCGREMSSLRMSQWLRAGVQVVGQPNWRFVKLHTHGCKDGNIDAWLGSDMQQFHRDLQAFAIDQPLVRYHYVTAWEMAQLVHQAEAGDSMPIIRRDPRIAIG